MRTLTVDLFQLLGLNKREMALRADRLQAPEVG